MLKQRLLAIPILIFILSQSILCQTTLPAQRIPFRDGNYWGYCDTLAKVIFKPQYDSTGFYNIGNGDFALFKKAGKFGLLDNTYKEVLPATYHYFAPLVTEYAPGWSESEYATFACGAAGAVGVQEFSKQLKPVYELVPAQYDSIDFSNYSIGLILVVKNNRWGAYQSSGRKICDAEYDAIYPKSYFHEAFDMGNGVVGKTGKEYYFISYWGKPVKLMVDTAPSASTNNDEVRKIVATGKATHGFEEVLFDKSEQLLYTPLFFVKKNKKIAIWDETTNQLTTSFYDDFMGIQYTESALGEPKIAEQAYYMLYFVKKEGKCGAVDENGITRIPFIYDGFGSISSFYFITRIKKKFGVNMISSIYPPIKPQYESFEHVINLPVSDTWQFCIFSATLNGKPGYVGENGKRYFIN